MLYIVDTNGETIRTSPTNALYVQDGYDVRRVE